MISKLQALLDLKIDPGFSKDDVVLYLGASHGVTAKMIAKKVRFVFCLDFSLEVMRTLIPLCKINTAMAPLLYDANCPEQYKDNVKEVSFLYQDLAQKNQVEIFLKNAETFLKNKNKFIFILKTRSVDATRSTKEVVTEVEKKLQGFLFQTVNLEQSHGGHYAFIGEKL